MIVDIKLHCYFIHILAASGVVPPEGKPPETCISDLYRTGVKSLNPRSSSRSFLFKFLSFTPTRLVNSGDEGATLASNITFVQLLSVLGVA